MFKRSPCLTYLYGALDTTPLPPKVLVQSVAIVNIISKLVNIISKLGTSQERKEREVRATQATRVQDLVATKDTIMQEVRFKISTPD